MPGPTLTESRLFESVTAPPADGDDVAVSAGTAPFRANFMQVMAGRDSYLYNGPHHGFLDHVRAEVTADGTDRYWVLRGIRAIAAERTDDTINRLSLGAGSSLALTGLSASTWYYVYGSNNAGTLALEATTTLPDGALRFSSGDTTRVYLGCFFTDGAGRAIPMVQNGKSYTFRSGYSGITGTPLALGTSSGAGHTIVSAIVPGHVRVVRVGYRASFDAVSITRTAGITTSASDTDTGFLESCRPAIGSADAAGVVDVAVAGDGTIALYASHATEATITARLVGFEE